MTSTTSTTNDLTAYAAGQIELGPIDKKTKTSYVCDAPSVLPVDVDLLINPHPYTRIQVAEFLGWVIKKDKGVQPDFKCKVAFHCLEAVE
ncbi:MAG: hypothetical protein ACYC3X_22095 [Pirellulaceae bacterium]